MNRYIFMLLLIIFMVIGVPAQNWQIRGKMPLPVAGGQIFVTNSSIYIIGGYSDSLQRAVDWIQIYNPAQNSWHIAGHLISPRRGFVADLMTDSVLIICGGVWENSPNLSSIERWKFSSNEAIGPHIQNYNDVFNRIYSSGHIYNGQLFLFGGFPYPMLTDSINLSYIARYNLTNASVTRLADTLYNLNELPYHMMSARITNNVYLFGGVHFAISNRVYSFNLDNFEYKAIGEMPQGRAGGGAVLIEDDIYLIGGYNESGEALTTVDIFATGLATFFTGSNLNFGRIEPMAAQFGDEILIFGGRDRYNQNIPWIEALNVTATTSAVVSNEFKESGYALEPNFPNPFNASTTFNFTIPQGSWVTVDIFSPTGELIDKIHDGFMSAGRHTVRWDSRDKYGNALASGIYIYKLQTGAYLYARKMILIR